MATSKQRRLFEELGLVDQAQEANPYEVLGLDPDFAHNLLSEDPSGAAVQFVAGALHKALSRRYHPDVPATGDSDRFRQINDADARIGEASVASLARWSKKEKTVLSGQLKNAQAERTALINRVSELLQADLELGNHPQHFSRLDSAQGVLLQRGNVPMLMRQIPNGGTDVLMGRVTDLDNAKATGNPQVFDFRAFLRQHQSFGLAPGSDIVAYIDETGRASILQSDLTFIMDITDPVAKQRKKRESESQKDKLTKSATTTGSWRADDPVMFITQIPRTARTKKPAGQLITFASWMGPRQGGQDLKWKLPLDVVGTVTDQGFFNRMRHNKATENIAISGTEHSKQ
jgi:hypothetical protein